MKITSIEDIIRAKKDTGLNVPDLLALARGNDPFYIGTDAHKRDAEWFADIWERFNYSVKDEVHIRRIHYRAVSQEQPILMPDGKAYENTVRCWQFITAASKYARWLKLVDPAKFDDRRNGKPEIFADQNRFQPGVEVYAYGSMSFDLPDLPDLPEYSLTGFHPEQRYHVEIWCEKSTMNDILIPLCKRYGLNLVTGMGELSLTACLWLVERVKELNKPTRILYLSDFDPAGLSMPVAVSRKIEKFILDYGTPDMDIKLLPVVLSHDQCKKYQLPRTPLKETELRAGKFQARFGEGATELDALEAVVPGELDRLLTETIRRYRDTELQVKMDDIRESLQDTMDRYRDDIREDFADEIEDIEREYSALTADYSERFAMLKDRVQSVWQDIQDRMEQVDADLSWVEPPDHQPDESGNVVLFDSGRDYFEQLQEYKLFQGKAA